MRLFRMIVRVRLQDHLEHKCLSGVSIPHKLQIFRQVYSQGPGMAFGDVGEMECLSYKIMVHSA